MNLSAPTRPVFLIALIIALVGILEALAVISVVPLASVWIVTIAFAVLALANLMKGI